MQWNVQILPEAELFPSQINFVYFRILNKWNHILTPLSLSTMPLRFIHVVTILAVCLFLLLSYSIVWIYQYLFICEYLGCSFGPLSKCVTHILFQDLFFGRCMFPFLLGKYLGLDLLAHMGNVYEKLRDTCSKGLYHFIIPPVMNDRCGCSTCDAFFFFNLCWIFKIVVKYT